jgi:hypothetical protein
MKIIYLLALAILLFGCTEMTGRSNETNASNITNISNITNVSNQTTAPAEWVRFNASGFSFEYPANMDVQESIGIFAGDHQINGETGELLVIVYYNTIKKYGENRDKEFQENPSVTASELLEEDRKDDPAQILDDVDSFGEVSTFSLSRDAYASEVPISTTFSGTTSKFTGYAISMYVPERSLHMKVRVLARDSTKAEDIRDRLISSLRIGS